MNGINIDPNLWGPSAWRFLHYITLSYPDKPVTADMDNMYVLFMGVARMLPCEKCRVEYSLLLKQKPLTKNVLSSRYNLVSWFLDIHNAVNIKLGKSTMSYDEFLNDYPVGSNTGNGSIMNYLDIKTITIILIVVVILILVLVLRLKNK